MGGSGTSDLFHSSRDKIFLATTDLAGSDQIFCVGSSQDKYRCVKRNKLSLNVNKPNFTLFISNRKIKILEPFVVKIDVMNIEQVCLNETKCVGFIITKTLSWDRFIKTIRNKVSKSIAIICKSRNSYLLFYLQNYLSLLEFSVLLHLNDGTLCH